jgi:uncharacterized protein (DUF488 family)
LLRLTLPDPAALVRAGVEALAGLRRPAHRHGEDTAVTPTVYTTGYEQHRRPEDLVAVLRGAGVERLVDVRELPLSRRRGFSKSSLAAALGDAGIAYEHERRLGNPKPLRDLYRSGRQADGEQGYRAHLRTGSSAVVDALAATLTMQRTCVLCFEADHEQCHRTLLVDELREREPALRVEHL